MTTETNTERLEITKDLLEWVEIYSTENSIEALKLTLEELTDGDHINWLIQQAEQLNDIENRSVLNSLKECSGENARLLRAHELKDMEHGGLIQQLKEYRKENARLREALEFYAAYQAYYESEENPSEVMKDYGKIARQALAGDTNA